MKALAMAPPLPIHYYRKIERGSETCRDYLVGYDKVIKRLLPDNFPYPTRQRDWELYQVLRQIPLNNTKIKVLDTGSFNTFTGLWLATYTENPVVSDLLYQRLYKSVLRFTGLLPRKKNELFYLKWTSLLKKCAPNLSMENIDLLNISYSDSTFDYITSISVIEHIRNTERAVKEMYRCLKPGGKLLITTDCHQEGLPLTHGVRFRSVDELEKLFRHYPVTSNYAPPDFGKENWCYNKEKVILAFIEITKLETAGNHGSPLCNRIQ